MSAVSQPQRSWWSLAQKSPSSTPPVFPSEKTQSQSKQSGKFNTLASVMGLKPKKSHPPPLSIQDPRSTVAPPTLRLVPRTEPTLRRPYTAPSTASGGRPPSNSVSSSRSRVDSIEPNTPKTPEDPAQFRRGSLLTLSDTDPFAARVVSVHSTPSDPNRLSAFSHSSAHEAKSPPDAFSRVSYASSSSQSFRMGGELSPLSVVSPVSDPGVSQDMTSVGRKASHSTRRRDVSSDSTPWPTSGGDFNRLSQPDPIPKPPRPAMRARGMTDTGTDRATFLRNDSFTRSPQSIIPSSRSPSSPNLVSRQVSVSRPTAPPTSELPSLPRSGEERALGNLSAGSASTSSLTFSPEFKPVSPRVRAKQPHETSPKATESGWEPEAPRHRTLKKSMSQQSLNNFKRGQPASPSSSVVALTESPNSTGPRKQRSFQRIPIPAVPLQLPLTEPRAVDPPQPGRKRLFSTSSSRRPSQSTLSIADDLRSLHSERAAPTSCWIDTDQPAPRTPISSMHEYTPQQIMSPAEMLQVEASVDAAYHSRPRGESIASSFALSDFSHEFGLSPSSLLDGGRKRSSSGHKSVRSDRSQEALYPPLAPEPPSPPVLMSLPPPPRRPSSHKPSLSRSQSAVVTPLSPPPRKILRPKVSVEEKMHRQSLFRKPSFLDIDDEMDKDPPSPPPPPPRMKNQDSFLDLTRESFDSVRSDDSLYN